jgi:chromosome partitioning protein
LITRYNGRAILSQELKEIIEETAGQIGTKPYYSIIREGIAIKETQTRQVSLFDGKKSNPAADYISFVDEYLRGVAE